MQALWLDFLLKLIGYVSVLTIIQNKYFQIVFLLWLWVFKTVFKIFEHMDFLFVSVIEKYVIVFSWEKKNCLWFKALKCVEVAEKEWNKCMVWYVH